MIVLVTTFAGMLPGCIHSISGGSDPRQGRTAPSGAGGLKTDTPKSTTPQTRERLLVNGQPIEANVIVVSHRDELSQRASTLSPEEYRVYVREASVQWINDKIAETLLYARAGLRIAPEVEKRVADFVDGEIRKRVTVEFGGVQRRFEKHLEANGTTLEEERGRLRREVIIASFLEAEIKPKVPEPTREEMMEAYRATVDAVSRPARRRMSLIDVRVTKRLPENVNNPTRGQLEDARADARSRIESARSELHSGVDFGEVARRYSDGLHAAEGGAWGWITVDSVRRRFVPAVEALEQLDTGEVSDIVETEDGFFLVRCDEFDRGHRPDFLAMQPDLKTQIERISFNRLIFELVNMLRTEAHFEPADLDAFHTAVVEAALSLETVHGP